MKVDLFVAVGLAAAVLSGGMALAQQSPTAPTALGQPPKPPGSSAGPARAAAAPVRFPVPIAPPTVKEMVESTVDSAADTILDPADVGKIKDKVMSGRRRLVTPSYPGDLIPKPVSRSIVIDPDPAQQPRMIRLSESTITSFVFADIAGNPWLLESKSFDPAMFSDGATGCGGGQGAAEADKQKKPSHFLNLQPCNPYAYGNVVVTLKDFPAPIVFMLATGQSDQVDVRVSVRVLGSNPDARPEIVVSEGTPEHDPTMQDFLDGVPPRSASALKVSGGIGQGWLYNGAMYFRSRFQVYAPAFHEHVGSADGLHVYKFRRAEPLVTVSNNGRPDAVIVSGY